MEKCSKNVNGTIPKAIRLRTVVHSNYKIRNLMTDKMGTENTLIVRVSIRKLAFEILYFVSTEMKSIGTN